LINLFVGFVGSDGWLVGWLGGWLFGWSITIRHLPSFITHRAVIHDRLIPPFVFIPDRPSSITNFFTNGHPSSVIFDHPFVGFVGSTVGWSVGWAVGYSAGPSPSVTYHHSSPIVLVIHDHSRSSHHPCSSVTVHHPSLFHQMTFIIRDLRSPVCGNVS
jgi:hypothetical protein